MSKKYYPIEDAVNNVSKAFKLGLKDANKMSENELDNAEKLLNEVVALLDSAAANNVIHKNNASRKQAHLRKLLDDAKKAN